MTNKFRYLPVLGLLVWFGTLMSLGNPEPAGEKLAQPANHASPEEAVLKGLSWLLTRQQPNGGWGPGHTTAGEPADVGNTCIAIQALWRAGIRPQHPKMGAPLQRGITFVLSEIETSAADSLYVTAQRATQLQRKLGTYVDTFIAAATLAEMKDQLPEQAMNQRLQQALLKVTTKIENHQLDDGTWQNQGWAPALAQGLAAKGINEAAQKGVAVDREVLRRTERYGRNQYDAERKQFNRAGSAGVELYAVASSLSSLDASVETNRQELQALKQRLDQASPAEKEKLREQIAEIRVNEAAQASAQAAMIARLSDQQFVEGFGSNGGEEFLSYLQISESLHRKGGSVWETWNSAMKRNLTRVQDKDGCWRGQHCITGGTFCTATAILVLAEENSQASKP